MITLINKTGATSIVGKVVTYDSSNPQAFVYAALGASKAIGVVLDAVAPGRTARIAEKGETAKVIISKLVSTGDTIRLAKVTDRISNGTGIKKQSTDLPYFKIGDATATSRGMVSCVLELIWITKEATGSTSGTITLSGDVNGTGTVGGTTTTTLASIISSGEYGDATHIPVFTVDTKGRVIAITEVPLSAVVSLDDDLLDFSSTKYTPYTAKAAGKLYNTDTTRPTNTNYLAYDGYYHATRHYGDLYTPDGHLQNLTIKGGDASGGAGSDGAGVYIRGGNAINGDSGSVAGYLYLIPGTANDGGGFARIYLGDSNAPHYYYDIRPLSAAGVSNVYIAISSKGAGDIALNANSGNAIIQGGYVALQTNLVLMTNNGAKVFRPDDSQTTHGSALTIKGGSVGSGIVPTYNGGNLYLYPGDPSGSGTYGSVRTGSASNYTAWDYTGHQTMIADARPWRDELGDALSLQRSGTGVSVDIAESTVDFAYNSLYHATLASADFLFKNVQLNHDRDLAVAIYPHIHWFQAKNYSPNFLLEYRWQINGGTKVTSWTKLVCNSLATTYVSGTIHQISYSAGISVPVGTTLSDIVQFRIYRDTSNASTSFAGTCPYNTGGNATVSVIAFDVHIQINSLGSTDEYVK